MDMVQLSRIHESAAQKYKVGFTEKYRCIYIDFSRRCAPIIKKNINLDKTAVCDGWKTFGSQIYKAC